MPCTTSSADQACRRHACLARLRGCMLQNVTHTCRDVPHPSARCPSVAHGLPCTPVCSLGPLRLHIGRGCGGGRQRGGGVELAPASVPAGDSDTGHNSRPYRCHRMASHARRCMQLPTCSHFFTPQARKCCAPAIPSPHLHLDTQVHAHTHLATMSRPAARLSTPAGTAADVAAAAAVLGDAVPPDQSSASGHVLLGNTHQDATTAAVVRCVVPGGGHADQAMCCWG
jgi:hypothetical protein